MEIVNRKANYNYFISDTLECGIVLKGTEIKSLREGKANINDAYALIKNNECYIINMYIAPYFEASSNNHEERRTRKLLLHKKEILKIKNKIDLEGYTLVPMKLYFNKNRLKVLIGLAKGKKLYDKRESEKKKDIDRKLRKIISK